MVAYDHGSNNNAADTAIAALSCHLCIVSLPLSGRVFCGRQQRHGAVVLRTRLHGRRRGRGRGASYRLASLWLLTVLCIGLLRRWPATEPWLGAVQAQATNSSDTPIVCPANLTCPAPLECYLAATGLTCLPPGTQGCRALPLPSGDYYAGQIAPIHSACQRCPLPGSPAQMQLLVDRYQQSVPGRPIAATLGGLGNCGPSAYCDAAQACQWRKKPLAKCDSSEQCLGACIQNNAAGYPTCFDPYMPRAEAVQRLIYFGIFFGVSVGLLLLAALACALAGQTRQRREFRACFVVAVLLALVLMGVAVYWEASPWPFSE
ncbi:hypothetical protein THASP1DRAFT_23818 [Thamnocephalis sphaerospora]|uniref:Uncharacterized protein n=1 Tax=Thamnocephalis sphaerospora TaxID=78915 RepID=A0A4V1IWN1_9FUNG|nr:hypothetical protein THASP1DRAFT_23818 [Thamnocephalis sphaerospora]|eukprot:RKP08139.1 hypothetical protein THASP1DRAFT_23818 [Thamnocephalis sphaerospora]